MRKFVRGYIKILFLLIFVPISLTAQFTYDSSFVRLHTLNNYITIDFQQIGSGLHFYNQDEGITRGPVYPFDAALAVGVNLTYKFLNIGYMQTVHNKVNRSAFVLGTNMTWGPWEFGVNYAEYKNLAILEPKADEKFPVDIKYTGFNTEAVYNFNAKRYSTRAVLYGEKIQRRSAGAFMLGVVPVYRYLQANSANSVEIVPDNAEFRPYFGKVAGMTDAKFINLNIRPGYSYTWAFKQGLYFLSAGAMLGTGFGYHEMNTLTQNFNGWHWQVSGRFISSAGYNGPRLFSIIQYRYTGSVSVLHPALISVEEGVFRLTMGYRFGNIGKSAKGESKRADNQLR